MAETEIIAGTYELTKKIGSGGAGIVYLGRHIRLDKPVVLKADKRKLTTKPEVLRREVDALKNLSHMYIPQVYDFIQENDTVYTVMDYIEGESLDKPLARGERFPQRQVVEWACELLEALVYLHTRPPHGILHSDIKPANIMVTPQNEIKLIDFNIALALGEDGSVRVGFSRGYASPEHYGLDLTTHGSLTDPNATELTDTGPTQSERPSSVASAQSSSTGSSRNAVLLDVRSDIYSVGATLYHLFSGQRPPADARGIEPLAAPAVSPAVAEIVNRAMRPNPDERYQTAAEMLAAFEHLHENDPRALRLRRQKQLAAALAAALFLAGGATAFAGSRQLRREEEAARVVAEAQATQERIAKETEQAAKTALERVDSARAALKAGDAKRAQELALKALEVSTQYDTSAQYALTDALGVYDLADGYKDDRAVTLSGEVVKQALSPDGRYAAVLAGGKVHVIDAAAGETIAVLPSGASALNDMVFSGGGTLYYAGEDSLRAYDPAEGRELWSAVGAVTSLSLSGDGSVLAAAEAGGEGAALYDAVSGEKKGTVSFGGLRRSGPVNAVFADPQDDVFTLDSSGRYLAVSFANGALKLLDTEDPDGEIVFFEESDYTRFEGGFFDRWFGFVAADGTGSTFYALDMETLELAGSMSVNGEMHLRVDPDGFCLSQNGVLVRLDVSTGKQTELAYTDSGIADIARSAEHTLLRATDGRLLFYDKNAILFDRHEGIACDFAGLAGGRAVLSNRNSPDVRVLRFVTHDDHRLFNYDALYRHDEARVDTSRQTVMLFSYKGFRLYGMDGAVIAEVELPDAEQIYDQQYRREPDGCWLDVIYNDGLTRRYSTLDGSLALETPGEKQNDSLDEEHLTEKFRIVSPLHGSPQVYARESGVLLRELDAEDFMTYATDVEGGIIAQYITAQGEAYGILYNESFEALARLPGLCDVLPDGTLIFDDMRGNLRESRIYSPQELTTLAENNLRR